MADRPPTLRQLLHEFTDDYALLDEPLEFTYTEWSHGRAELARCAQSGESAIYPKCMAGFILRSERALSPGIFGTEPVLNGTHIAGVCPCRCHRSDAYGASAKRTAAMYGIPDFDEDQLPGDEAADD